MQIKTIRSALISNYEVLKLLEESQEAQKQVQKLDPSVEYPEHLRTIQFEVSLGMENFWSIAGVNLSILTPTIVNRILERNTMQHTDTRAISKLFRGHVSI